MAIPLFQVDAFTSKPFAGNPAAVCMLSEAHSEEWMQAVASEMNLSETAFLRRQEDGYELRWFTPTTEVDLCGHATLASAHVLWEAGYLDSRSRARFHTRSGLLTAIRRGDWIELDFPAEPEKEALPPVDWLQVLGAKPKYTGSNRFAWLVEVASEEIVRKMQPDFASLKTLTNRGVIVTSIAESAGFDFVSRFFAPALGIDEDPVTGSAHCCLGPYWHRRLGKNEFTAYQASARGGVVRVKDLGECVLLQGQAVTAMRGEIVV
ncbi:PhzF family phenazine biosynthesis protein [candidate division KSB1 bacterium]|nr:PhzF family phenazine biosynthesis protein [candidate division KSB1 bacterium]